MNNAQAALIAAAIICAPTESGIGTESGVGIIDAENLAKRWTAWLDDAEGPDENWRPQDRSQTESEPATAEPDYPTMRIGPRRAAMLLPELKWLVEKNWGHGIHQRATEHLVIDLQELVNRAESTAH